MSQIVSIEEGTFDSHYDGFIITLEGGHQIQLGISNSQSCCENWGYLMSEDNLDHYVGAEYLGLDIVDEALESTTTVNAYSGSGMFININTSRGTFQFTAYNQHNGYYGHSAVVVVGGVIAHSEYL